MSLAQSAGVCSKLTRTGCWPAQRVSALVLRHLRLCTTSEVNSTLAPSQSRPAATSAFARVCRDVAALRESFPAFVYEVGDPTVAPLIVRRGQLVAPLDQEGPWDVEVTLAHNEGTVYYEPMRLRLRFGGGWPHYPPLVRFHGLLANPLLDSARGPPNGFYERLPMSATTDGRPEFSIPDILEAARKYFANPVESLGLANTEDESGLLRRLRTSQQAALDLNMERLKVIRKYAQSVRHPFLFGSNPRTSIVGHGRLDPELESLVASKTPVPSSSWRSLLTEHLPGEVFSFPLFTESFCDELLEEVFSFYNSGLPARRPNSMNNYGIVLNDIGLESFVDEIQRMLQPLGHALFPGIGSAWDGHHCFIVRYRAGEDLGLDMHTDDSDVTFNVCLGTNFSGAGLQFCGMQGAPDHRKHSHTYQHVRGRCVVHLGNKRHGADDISDGERLNLILWNHSSAYRQSNAFRSPDYRRELGPPDPVCVSYTHDRDYGSFKEYTQELQGFQGRGWCPPSHAEYPGFAAEPQPM